LQTFDISHAFLPLTIAKLSTFKNNPVFWPTLYNITDWERQDIHTDSWQPTADHTMCSTIGCLPGDSHA